MKSLTRFVFGSMVTLIGVGAIGFQPAALAWAGQATGHDHAHDTAAPPAAAASQPPPVQDAQQMAKMREQMIARMAAADTQIKTLGAEMNAAKTTDAKLTAMTKLLNVLIEQRSMMRMQMDMQDKKTMEQMMSMHQMMMQQSPPAR
jgi:hypothetical protein